MGRETYAAIVGACAGTEWVVRSGTHLMGGYVCGNRAAHEMRCNMGGHKRWHALQGRTSVQQRGCTMNEPRYGTREDVRGWNVHGVRGVVRTPCGGELRVNGAAHGIRPGFCGGGAHITEGHVRGGAGGGSRIEIYPGRASQRQHSCTYSLGKHTRQHRYSRNNSRSSSGRGGRW